MSVVAVLGADLKKYVKLKPRADVSSTILKLHRITAGLLSCCSILTTSKQYFGDNIHCMLGGGSIDMPVFQSYCFMTSTYTLPIMSNTTSAHPGVYSAVVHNAEGYEEGVTYHNYYQWVCLLLTLQACVCYLPMHLWKGMEGGRVGKLLAKISEDPLTETPVTEQVSSLARFLLTHGGWFNRSAIKLLLCQTACLVLTVGQMYTMDIILGNHFLQLGTHIFNLELIKHSLTKVFPKVVRCSMNYFGPSGDIVNNSGMCTLPINIINEKIYLTIWIWFIVLTLISIISLLYQSCILLSNRFRQLELQRLSPQSPQHRVRTVIKQSTYGDMVLLQLIAKNTDTTQFTEILAQICVDQPYSVNTPSLPSHLHHL